MNKIEKELLEAIDTYLQQDSKLGLSIHKKGDYEGGWTESTQYMRELADELFHVKTADLAHYVSIGSAFSKVHVNIYLCDTRFADRLTAELKARGVPPLEIEAAVRKAHEVYNELKDMGYEDAAGNNYNINQKEIANLYK